MKKRLLKWLSGPEERKYPLSWNSTAPEDVGTKLRDFEVTCIVSSVCSYCERRKPGRWPAKEANGYRCTVVSRIARLSHVWESGYARLGVPFTKHSMTELTKISGPRRRSPRGVGGMGRV